MSLIWSNYWTEGIQYQRQTGALDRSGKPVYDSPVELTCRLVSGGLSEVINKDSDTVKYTEEYQIPYMISENDLINGRLVVSVESVSDVFGNFHYCIARVK